MADLALSLSPSHSSPVPPTGQEGSPPGRRDRKWEEQLQVAIKAELDNTWSTQDMELISNTSAGEFPSDLTFR